MGVANTSSYQVSTKFTLFETGLRPSAAESHSTMTRTHFCRKKTLLSVALLLLCTFGLVIYYRYQKGRQLTMIVADSDSLSPVKPDEPLLCDKWAVVSTGDSEWASEAVRRQSRLQDWCLLIVFGERPSVNYDPEWYQGRGNKAVVYLTRQDARRLNELSALKSIPWSDVGRKDIGYLYAIAHGAKMIWDFDDFNMLKFWIPDAAPPGAPSLVTAVPSTDSVQVREVEGHSWPTFNPHPVYHAPTTPSWPRGLPLDDALKEECSVGTVKAAEVPNGSIAVLHSLSDRQPDADVIFQSTMPFPFYFQRTTETKPLMVPPQTFSPYNAKATLHLQSALWAMYLPVSVEKELSDTWRGYIAQRLFWDAGLRVGFTARPLVVQDHDLHFTRVLAQSQLRTSIRTKQLISFLGAWRGKQETFVGRIVELWAALCDKKFVNLIEIKAVQSWLKALQDAKYTFPELKGLSISSPTYPTDASTNVPSFPDIDIVRYTTGRNTLEYSDEVCKYTGPSLTFWNSDTHYGSRLDMSSYLGSLGHNVYEAVGTRHNYHPEVWSMPGVHVYDKVSNVIKRDYPNWTGMNSRLKESMIKENFEFYKNDQTCSSVDAFYCNFPASMCEMWMPFNKTTIVLPAHRYSMGRCTREEFDRLNEHLRTLASMERPKNFMAASSKYDMEYLRHYTGVRDVMPLYAHSATYLKDIVYSPDPSHQEIILFLCKWNPTFFWDNRFVTEVTKFKIVDQAKFFRSFLFSNFVKHRAAIYLPYAVMSYKITELYTMGIPLFFPSMKYLQNIKPIGDDRTILARYYCAHTGLGLKDSDMVAHPNSIHPYSPNLQENVDKESEYYWLQLADFFQWPHLTYFDDFKDLERKLEEANFDRIHELMMAENKKRNETLKNNWCKIFNKIEKGRRQPQNYESAIKELYGVTQLQVY